MKNIKEINWKMEKLQNGINETKKAIISELSYSKDLRDLNRLKELLKHRSNLKAQVNLLWGLVF